MNRPVHNSTMRSRLAVFSSVALLTACGGGGGGGGEPPPPPNVPPSARAGSPQTVVEQATVILDGSGSSDADGTLSAYQWAQISGPTVAISNGSQAQANFLAPTVSGNTLLVFQLTVTDDDSATGTSVVTITVQPATFTLSGTITAPEGTIVDGDVNDPNAPYVPNDDAVSAQLVSNPVTVGGYVNLVGEGEPGASFDRGDRSDYYRAQLIAGQTIMLFVADPDAGDPDLYLWDASGDTILDFSLNVGSVESLVVPSNGEFLIEAYAFEGASNYILTAGQTQIAGLPGGFRLSDDFVPGEVITRHQAAGTSNAQPRAVSPLIAKLGLKTQGGGPGREALLALDQQSAIATMAQSASDQSAGLARAVALGDDEQRRKYETLMAIKKLNRDSAVEYAHPNYIVKATAVPNDQYYPLQWHYPLINLPAAWDTTTGAPDVVVAVLDTGVLLNHPDLQGQLVPGYDFVSNPQSASDGNGIDANADDPGDGTGPQPSSFHGTHVAGTIAAASNNGSGFAGVAWNAKVMPVRVLGVGGGTTYDILQGVRYAAGLDNDSGQTVNPVDVINLSLGGPGPCSAAAQDVLSLARQAGVTVLVAAGNDNVDAGTFTPASCDNVITVSAVGIDKSKAPYSNFGTSVDLAAPGGDTSRDLNGDGYPDGVLSVHGDDSSSSIVFTGNFLQGTSMASPHVAGVAALMKAVNASLTPDQIDVLLTNGELTDDIGDANLYGNGLINAQKAVFAALNAAGTPPAPNPRLGATPATLSFGATLTLGVLTVRNTGGGDLQVDPPSVSAAWLSVVPVDVSNDNLGTYAVVVDRTGLADGTYSDGIIVQSSVNSIQVPVIMQVVSTAIEPDVGYLYTLLIDSETGEVVDQVTSAAAAGEYAYEFVDVPDGVYEIVTGTDADNDNFICDAGEACGGFLTLFEPVVIEVDGDTPGLDFSAGHIVAIPAQSSQVKAGSPARARMPDHSPKQIVQ